MASLRQVHTWMHFPWSVYAVYISQMINFAAVWDPLLVWTLTRSNLYLDSTHQTILLNALLLWILSSKLIKITPHFRAHPSDLVWLPAYLVFAYVHSFIKLYCALTFWDHSWNGRNLELTQMASVENLRQPEELCRRISVSSASGARPNIQLLRGTTGLYDYGLVHADSSLEPVKWEDSGVAGLVEDK